MKLKETVILIVFAWISSCTLINGHEYSGNKETAAYWTNHGKDAIHAARLLQKPNIGVAKNVILFLGDGMGVSTVTAARILKGQLKNETGEEQILSFETFPHIALSKTYNQDAQTPDSAGTATAFYTGIKTNQGVLGVDARVRRTDCASQNGTEIDGIKQWSAAAGKSTGFVSTARATHATPAALYSHSAERNWECDMDKEEDPGTETCVDIAKQLIYNNTDLKVMFAGGRGKFLLNGTLDPEDGLLTEGRLDEDLTQRWQTIQQEKGRTYKYMWNKTEFDQIDVEKTDYVFGLFNKDHMEYELDRDDENEPSIAEMTTKAIQILQKNNDKGFFLLVEAGRIDHGHHKSNAARALHDTLALADAVQAAMDMTSAEDTLLVTTADHSHVFTLGGYPTRGNPILGLTDDREGGFKMGDDEKPFTTLMYSNGPGAYADNTGSFDRPNLTQMDPHDKDFLQQSAVPLSSETHGGEDVAIYARGPMSHLFHGVHEQSYIAHVMAYASCVGDYSIQCARDDVEENQQAPSSAYDDNNTNSATHSVQLNVFYIALVATVSICYRLM